MKTRIFLLLLAFLAVANYVSSIYFPEIRDSNTGRAVSLLIFLVVFVFGFQIILDKTDHSD